jgi:phage shock protein PspC (stress-responsive transcriptional regulator)
MTQTTQATYSSPRLERPREAPFRGVCAAVARTTGTDPVLWRVLIVVLVFFGGLGILLYLAGLVAIPREGEERSVAERLLHGPDRHLSGGQVAVVVLLVLALAGFVSDTDGLLVVAVVAVLGLMWWRGRTETSPVAAPAAAPVGYGEQPPAPATWTPPPPRPRSPLGGVTVSLAAVVVGVLLLVGVSGPSVPAEVVLAAGLGVVGLGLVVGAFLGRSVGLVLLAGALGLALAGTVAARPVIDAGVGDRTWRPTGSADYRLGVGDATLDLRDVPLRESGTIGIDARVDVGHLLVLVPAGARVSLDARAQLGDLLVLGDDTNGRKVARHVELGPEGAPQLRVDASVRTGQVEVRRG